MIDRVVKKLGRKLSEVPVGFKWFAPGLFDGTCCFGGEESAGASFLRRDGTVWTTDKDGLDHGSAGRRNHRAHRQRSGRAFPRCWREFGSPYYTRIDAAATPEQKAKLGKLSPESVKESDVGRRADHREADARAGQRRAIGGLKVASASGWFAARPPARRTSTRSTPRASRTKRTWKRSSTKLSRS